MKFDTIFAEGLGSAVITTKENMKFDTIFAEGLGSAVITTKENIEKIILYQGQIDTEENNTENT